MFQFGNRPEVYIIVIIANNIRYTKQHLFDTVNSTIHNCNLNDRILRYKISRLIQIQIQGFMSTLFLYIFADFV